ncbi:MAG: DUF1501 domain-containing protein [Planctomycetes bacterium]|nr:DUF1501 domain-containing protein [Planctomycetota bacterium]
MLHRYCDGLSRRDALHVGWLGLAGLSLTDWLRFANAESQPAQSSTADAVLFVNLAGGPSHLDTLDMKPEGPVETRGEFAAIQSKLPGLAVCEHLPKLAQAIDQFTLLRGISHTTGDHPQGQAYIATGNRPSPAVKYPSYGSIVSKERPGRPDMSSYVAIPQTEWTAGYMGDGYAPFQTNAVPRPGEPFAVRGLTLAPGVTLEKVNRREKLLKDLDVAFREADTDSRLLEAFDTFGRQAHSMVTSPRTRSAFDVSLETESLRGSFADDELGQSLLLAVRLIEHGVPFITVTNGGWDTHLDNFTGHQKLLGPLDAGVTAAVSALREKGLLERTLVVIMGEFGRTPKINPNVGRDHYPRVNWCLVTGGGVRPGQLVGATDEGGEAPTDETDIRPDDIGATILHALGIDHELEYYTETGRPVSLIPHGRVLHHLFG